jgi:Holliday junction resolvase-like predicted endonuclease
MTEAQFKTKVLKPWLKERGFRCYSISQRFSSGFPDLVALKNRRVAFVEVKIDDRPLTALQQKTLREIAETGNMALVIRRDTRRGVTSYWRVMSISPGDAAWIDLSESELLGYFE